MAHGDPVTSAELAVPQRPGAAERWTPPTVGPVGAADAGLTPSQLNILDEVMYAAELATGLRFSVYLGDLGDQTRSTAEGLHDALGDEAPVSVLLALSPGQRVVEVVTGAEAQRRISDRSARLAVLSAISSASEGDLVGALVNGVRTLADQAGTLPERSGW